MKSSEPGRHEEHPAPGSRPPAVVPSIESLAERYELFLFDQFGVLHDGLQAIPGRLESLRMIRAAGARIGVVTNSGKRADYNSERLARFGFDTGIVDVVISSGEVAWRLLSKESGWPSVMPCNANGPLRALVIGRGLDRGFVENLALVETDDAEQCDLVLIAGAEPERFSRDDYRTRLEPAARRGVLALCTNPDRVMLLGNGRTGFSAGQVADDFACLGGEVLRVGKPWPDIYAHALDLGGTVPDRTLCIGDSVEHDIAGAVAAGCDSLLVRTGIHAQVGMDGLDALFDVAGCRPTWLEAGRAP